MTYVACALIVSEFITLGIVSAYLRKTIDISLIDLMRACGKSALVALFSAVIPLIVRLFWGDSQSHSWLPLSIGMLGATIGWVAGVLLTRHPLTPHLMSLLRSIRLLYPR